MKQNKTILELLIEIPKENTKATIQGVEMQIIDTDTRQKMLETESVGNQIYDCILTNGTFLFQTKNGILEFLYKVM